MSEHQQVEEHLSSSDESSEYEQQVPLKRKKLQHMNPLHAAAQNLSADSEEESGNEIIANEFVALAAEETVTTDNSAQYRTEQPVAVQQPPVAADDEWQEDSLGEDESVSRDPSISDGNMRVVASHYNELKESGRKERLKSRILHMRNFNNWIKSQLIFEYMSLIKSKHRIGDPLRVLDMCCGKGGDLLKWEKSNIHHLICTDIAEVSVDQCKQRYGDMLAKNAKQNYGHRFSAEFFACDSTLVRLRERYKDKTIKLNLVSCQFAFHYSFESLSQADCMVHNAAECLEEGGYFIATIPDANEIMRRLRASGEHKFGNDVYSIEFANYEQPPPLFGAKYQFHLEGVVDCPEFLVHFPTLVKLCRKHGLKLVRKTTFADYYKETLEKGRSLLHRMGGLETVYPNRVASSEQYVHLADLQKFGNNSRPVGTLSKEEWEATSLYLVCAFQKVKLDCWDNEGKPVFKFDDEIKTN